MSCISRNLALTLVSVLLITSCTLPGTSLMVGRFDQSTVKEIEVALHRFEMAGIEIKGFILNAVEKKASSTYGYYNYSYASDKE